MHSAQQLSLLRQLLMDQARSEEEEKEIGKTEARRLIERKAAQQNKTHRRLGGSKTRHTYITYLGTAC